MVRVKLLAATAAYWISLFVLAVGLLVIALSMTQWTKGGLPSNSPVPLWITAAGIAALIVGVFVARYIRSLRRALQQRRLDEKSADAVQHRKPFGLFLRPFSSDERLFAKQRDSMWRAFTPFSRAGVLGHGPGWWALAHKDKVEEVLYFALKYRIPVVAIGRNDITYGVSRIETTDVEWKRKFEELARMSKVIVCIPYPSPGSAWELEWIREHGRDKTIFLVPPASAMIEGKPYVAHWDDCAGAFRWIPNLPRPKGGWQFFTVAEGRAAQVFDWDLYRLRNLVSRIAKQRRTLFEWAADHKIAAAILMVVVPLLAFALFVAAAENLDLVIGRWGLR